MACYSCIHLMHGADGARRCRVAPNALKVSRRLEAACKAYVRNAASDGIVPGWYWLSTQQRRVSAPNAEVGVASQI